MIPEPQTQTAWGETQKELTVAHKKPNLTKEFYSDWFIRQKINLQKRLSEGKITQENFNKQLEAKLEIERYNNIIKENSKYPERLGQRNLKKQTESTEVKEVNPHQWTTPVLVLHPDAWKDEEFGKLYLIIEYPTMKPKSTITSMNIWDIEQKYNGKVKIGFTAVTVKSRLSQLQVASPTKLISVYDTLDFRGAKKYEKSLHHLYKKLGRHIRGEWFTLSFDEILGLISELEEDVEVLEEIEIGDLDDEFTKGLDNNIRQEIWSLNTGTATTLKSRTEETDLNNKNTFKELADTMWVYSGV